MSPLRGVALGVLAAVAIVAAPAAAGRWTAAPGEAGAKLLAAQAGDTVVLARGTHPGPLVMRTRVVLAGAPGAVVHGGHHGSAIVVLASGAAIEDLAIEASGRDRRAVDAGVRVSYADDVRLARLRIRDALYGIHGERASRLRVERCDLTGRGRPGDGDVPEGMEGGGNGVHLWTCLDATLTGTRIAGFMDGVYLSFAHRARIDRCLLHDNVRYGLHTMYCQEGTLERSRFTRNAAGCAIMFSNHLRVEDNAFVHNKGPRTYGLLLRDCSDGRFARNQVGDNTIGFFMDNSNRNRLEDNRIVDNGWGVLLFSSCADNVLAGNDFIQNDHPVALDMRHTRNAFDDGTRGNHWSEHAAWDLDADGRGDAPYSPVSAFAFLSKQYPDLTLLTHSPAVLALASAEKVLPALRPSEAVDRMPSPSPLARAGAAPAADTPGSRPAASRTAGGWASAAGFALTAGFGLFVLSRGART